MDRLPPYVTCSKKTDLVCFILLTVILLAGAKKLAVYYKAPKHWKTELQEGKKFIPRELHTSPQAR